MLAAILLRAWRDAEAGDAEALAWLRQDGRAWLTILGIHTHLLTENNMPRIHILSLGSDKEEKARGLRDAQAIAAVVPDADTPRRAAEPPRPATPEDPAATIPAANTAPAAVALAGLLDTLSPEDLRALLAQEEARRAAIAAQQEAARLRALEGAAARAERERKAQARAEIEPALAALSTEIQTATAMYSDMRDAALAQAAHVNGLILKHSRLWARLIDATEHPIGEFRPWERPHRWAREHTIDVQTLERAQAGD